MVLQENVLAWGLSVAVATGGYLYNEDRKHDASVNTRLGTAEARTAVLESQAARSATDLSEIRLQLDRMEDFLRGNRDG